MPQVRDWQAMKAMHARLLEERSGEGVAAWNLRIRKGPWKDEKSLRAWLAQQGVMGYPQSFLVMERFGYPDFMLATADELVDDQYAHRTHLWAVFEAIIRAAMGLGEVTIQARKTYVSLVTSRRTFARVQATTKERVDLGLRLSGRKARGRLQPSKIHESTPLQVSLYKAEDVDAEVLEWLQLAYDQNT